MIDEEELEYLAFTSTNFLEFVDKEKYMQEVAVLDPLVITKIEVFVLGQVIEKYYALKDKNKMPRSFKLSSEHLNEPTSFLAQQMNSKITDKDVLESKLFEQQKKNFLNWLMIIVDNSPIWIITPERLKL